MGVIKGEHPCESNQPSTHSLALSFGTRSNELSHSSTLQPFKSLKTMIVSSPFQALLWYFLATKLHPLGWESPLRATREPSDLSWSKQQQLTHRSTAVSLTTLAERSSASLPALKMRRFSDSQWPAQGHTAGGLLSRTPLTMPQTVSPNLCSGPAASWAQSSTGAQGLWWNLASWSAHALSFAG